jgi:hypothetical protein
MAPHVGIAVKHARVSSWAMHVNDNHQAGATDSSARIFDPRSADMQCVDRNCNVNRSIVGAFHERVQAYVMITMRIVEFEFESIS